MQSGPGAPPNEEHPDGTPLLDENGATAGVLNRGPAAASRKRRPKPKNRPAEDSLAGQQLEEEEPSCPQMKKILDELADLRAQLQGRPLERDNRTSILHSASYAPDVEPSATFCKATRRMCAASPSRGSARGTPMEWIPPIQVELPEFYAEVPVSVKATTPSKSHNSRLTNDDTREVKMEEVWSKRVAPYRDKDRKDLQDRLYGDKDYEVCELFLRRLQDELQLGELEKADQLSLLPSEEPETFEFFFSPEIPGLKVTAAGVVCHGDDHAGCVGGKPWRELAALKVEILEGSSIQGGTKNLHRNEAGALWRGCTANQIEDTWAMVEALVQVVARAVDEWCLQTVAPDESQGRTSQRRTLESRETVTQGIIHMTAAPRARDAHACHEESAELWQAVAGQGLKACEDHGPVEPSPEPGKRCTALEEAIRRLRHKPNSNAPAGCHLLHHALQLRRKLEFPGESKVSGPSPKAGRKFTGPVLLLALQMGDVTVVKKLLSSRADPNETYTEHNIGRYKADATLPLMFAALESEKKNSKELLQLMLAYKADINARAVLNCYVHGTILWTICWSNRCDAEEILCFLLAQNADMEMSNGWCVDHPPMYLDGAQDDPCGDVAKKTRVGVSAKLTKAKTQQSSGAVTHAFSSAPTTILSAVPNTLTAERPPLEFCPGRKYTALGGAVVKGARKLVNLLVEANAEVTRHELRIAVAISNAFLVRMISRASASGKRPEEALLLLKDFNKGNAQTEADKGSRQSISDVCVQQPQKERLRYVGDVSQVHKDLLSEMLSAIVTNPYAVQKLQQLVRDDTAKAAKNQLKKLDFEAVDPALNMPCFVSRLIRHSPEAAGLLLDKIYFQEPECPSGNPVPVQCYSDTDQQMNTVYTEGTKWQHDSARRRSRKISLAVRWEHEPESFRREDSDAHLEVYAGSEEDANLGRHLKTIDLDDCSTVLSERFHFCTKELDTCIVLAVKSSIADQKSASEPVVVKLEELQAGEPFEETLKIGEGRIRVELHLDCPEIRLRVSGQDEDDEGEMDKWQLELLGSQKSRNHRQFCDIRILHIKQIIRLELFNAISSVPRTERLELLQNSEALQAVIHYTWVTWARPQHLVLLIWSAIRVIGLLIWVVIIPLSAKDVVSQWMCETVVMVCWAQFAAFAFLEISDNLAAFCVEWSLAKTYGLRNSRSTLSNADWYDWLKDGLVIVCAVDGWGSWETCSYARHHSIFAAALLICCYHFLYCMRPFRGLGYALVPILDTLSPATAGTGKVSNLSAMLIIVTFLVTAIGLFAVVEFGDGEEGVWPIFVKTFMNVIVGEAELIDLEGFSDTQFGVVATMGAFFGIGVVLMNIFIAVVGNSYDEMLKYNLGSFLDRRNQICEKAVLLRRICLQHTKKFVKSRGPLGAPEMRRGPFCLFGLVTPLQATLLKQVWIVSFVMFALVCVVGFVYQTDVEPLLIFVSIIVLMTGVKVSGILCHTLEPPGGINKTTDTLWFVPKCYVWAAKCPKEGRRETTEPFDPTRRFDARRDVPGANSV